MVGDMSTSHRRTNSVRPTHRRDPDRSDPQGQGGEGGCQALGDGVLRGRVSVRKAAKSPTRRRWWLHQPVNTVNAHTRPVPLLPGDHPRESSVKAPAPRRPRSESPGAWTTAAAHGRSEPWKSESLRARGSLRTAGSETRAPSAPEAWALPPTPLERRGHSRVPKATRGGRKTWNQRQRCQETILKGLVPVSP